MKTPHCLFCLYTAIMTSISPAEARFSFITGSALLIRKNFLPCLPSCCQFASLPSGRKQAWRPYLNLSEFRKTHLPNKNCEREVNEGLFISRALCSRPAAALSLLPFTQDVSAAAALRCSAVALCPPPLKDNPHPPSLLYGKKWSSGLKCDTKWKNKSQLHLCSGAQRPAVEGPPRSWRLPAKRQRPKLPEKHLTRTSISVLFAGPRVASFLPAASAAMAAGRTAGPDRLGLCRRERMRERGGEGES